MVTPKEKVMNGKSWLCLQTPVWQVEDGEMTHVRLFSLSAMIFIVSEHEPQAEHRSDWNLCFHVILTSLVSEKEVSHNPKRWWWWQVTAKYLKWTICLQTTKTSEAVMHNSAKDILSAKGFNKQRIPHYKYKGKTSWDHISYTQCKLWT